MRQELDPAAVARSADLAERIAALSLQQRAALLSRIQLQTAESLWKRDQAQLSLEDWNHPPLSFAQQRLWFLEKLYPGTDQYNLANVIRLHGRLDIPALQASVNAIVQRHDVLRAFFIERDGKPVQILAPETHVDLPVEDLRDLAPDMREQEVARCAKEHLTQPFDLTQPPLLRLKLLWLGEVDHALLFAQHHIISDAWSMRVFQRELAGVYAAFKAHQPSPLPPLQFQYADYARWQMKDLALDGQLAYWKQCLDGASQIIDLPRRKNVTMLHSGRQVSFGFPPALLVQLENFSRREAVTAYMMALAAFYVLLQKYSGQDDLAIGSPIAGRSRAETENLIGFFVNTLVLRTNVGGNPTARELIKRVRETALGAFENQDLPFDVLVEELCPERILGQTPLFDVVFAFQNLPKSEWTLPDVRATVTSVEPENARFDLTMHLVQSGDRLQGMITYREQVFEPSLIQRMAGHYVNIIQELVERPDARIGALRVLTPEEESRISVEWNSTAPCGGIQACLHHLFERQARQSPERVAVQCEESRLTYAELNSRANQLAHYLLDAGAGPDVVVGLLLDRACDILVAMLGILKAHAAYLPIDSACPPDRIEYIMRVTGAPILVTQSALAPNIKTDTRVICMDRDWDAISHYTDSDVLGTCDPRNLAYVIFTSGSTGKPKGVAIEHANIVSYVSAVRQRMGLLPGSSYATVSTFAADLGNTVTFPALASGGTLHIISSQRIMDAEAFSDYMSREGIDCLKVVPSHFIALQSGSDPSKAMPRKLLVVGGEASSWEAVGHWRQLAPECRVLNHYGPTEATVGVLTAGLDERNESDSERVPLGRPIANTTTYILDKHMQLVPPGVAGELYIGGANVARGYAGLPLETADRFVPDPFSASGKRLYRTGDRVCHLEDGSIEFLGRFDNQVKLRGYRVELGEIEAVLEQLQSVERAVVIVSKQQESDARLVAYVQHRPEHPKPDVEQLRQHLARCLPDYMIPAVIVALEALPLTGNGKIDRRRLPEVAPAEVKSYVAPRKHTEQVLCNIWADLLRAPQVGIDDNFFHLGGDSILSIQIIARAARAGIGLTVAQLFEHQTVRSLAPVARTPKVDGSDQARVVGEVPLTPIQRRFFEADLAQPHHYNQSMLLEPTERLKPEFLRRAVDELIAHHDALSFRFEKRCDGWRQIAGSLHESVFSTVDLSGLSAAVQSRQIELLSGAAKASLDLSSGPIIRVLLFDLGDALGQRVLITIHHLVIDGVSWRILLEDLEAAYRQIRSGSQVFLQAKTASFQRWSNLLTQYAQSEAHKNEVAMCLDGAPERITSLPLDGPGGPNIVASVDKIAFNLTAAETRTLLHTIPRLKATVDQVLLTALARAFERWTGNPFLWVTMESHGREDLASNIDISRTIGWFTAIYPVKLDINGVSNLLEGLRRIGAQLERIPNRGIGWLIWRYLSGHDNNATRLRRMSQPEVSYNYLGQFDSTFTQAALFHQAQEQHGACRGAANTRFHKLDLCGSVQNGILRLTWTYSRNLHRADTVNQVAAWHLEAVRELLRDAESMLRNDPACNISTSRIGTRDLQELLRRVAQPS